MRLIMRILAALVLTVVVLAAGLVLLPGENVAALAAGQVEAQTGRKLEFGGKVRFTLWPALGVTADAVTLSNAGWAGPEPMLAAERLAIGVAAGDLLRGKVRVTELRAILPQLNLARRADGTGNWEFGTGGAGDAAGAGRGTVQPAPISIGSVSLTGASLRYSEAGKAPVEFRNMDLELDWPDPAGTAHVDLTLRPAGEPVRITGEVGTFAAFLSGQVSSIGATLAAPGGSLRFDGHAGTGGEATGRVTLKAEDTRRLAAALGLPPVEPPRGLDRGVAGGADATYTADGRLSLRDLALDVAGNRLSGAADVVFGGVPQITAQLTGKDLDLSALAGGASAPAPSPAGDSAGDGGWSTAPLDASALGLIDGTLDLSFDSLASPGLDLGPSKLSLSIDRSRAVLKLLPAAVFGGQLQGQLVANNRNGLSVGGNLTFTGIRLEQALERTAGISRLNGEALGAVEFLAAGSSADALMRSLSGKGWAEAGKGFFTGFDLEELMRRGSGNGGSTVFDQFTGSFTMLGGNLQNDDLLVTLKGVRAAGTGRIGIGARDLDYLFTPTVLRGSGKGLSIPVAITGPWSDPRIRPDLKRALEPEIDAVEERAKDKLREKLSEELDTEIAPKQDLNDVLRNRIEEEARKQLMRLLQGN
ncbi:AsmA family protein [Roseobacteraceae bacterium NS-SX3]